MSLSITDLKKGTIFQSDGVPYRVVDYSQKVMGRGGSIVNVRIKSLLDGRVLEKTFKGNEQLQPADVITQNVQYLYSDGAKFYFMDEQTFEQFELIASIIGDQTGYLKEGDRVQALVYNGNVISVELPKSILLKVTYAEDVVRGDTTSSVMKDAKLETGLTIKVPAFVKTGDVVKVDSRTGDYLERARS
ncbi:MAG: elongation factor P [Candidatus Saccharimonadales bacterium]